MTRRLEEQRLKGLFLSLSVQNGIFLCIQPYICFYKDCLHGRRGASSKKAALQSDLHLQPLFLSVIVATVIETTESKSEENRRPRTQSSAAQNK